jgi:hypothetical protein
MRKIAIISIPLAVAILLGITLIAINSNRSPDWKGDLTRYLQYKNSNIHAEYEIMSTVKARTPWNFTAEMSRGSFGESMYYQTDIRYSMDTPDHETDSILPKTSPKGDLMDLPFPPVEVWCVFLKMEDKRGDDLPAEESLSIVLVALHQDLYNSDFIIHEIEMTTQTKTPGEVVKTIGCE